MTEADVSVFSSVWAVLIGQHYLWLVTAELSAVKNTDLAILQKIFWRPSNDLQDKNTPQSTASTAIS